MREAKSEKREDVGFLKQQVQRVGTSTSVAFFWLSFLTAKVINLNLTLALKLIRREMMRRIHSGGVKEVVRAKERTEDRRRRTMDGGRRTSRTTEEVRVGVFISVVVLSVEPAHIRSHVNLTPPFDGG